MKTLSVFLALCSVSATEHSAPPGRASESPCLPCSEVDKSERPPISEADRVRATRELEDLRHALKAAHEVKVALKGGGKMDGKRISYVKYFPVDKVSRDHLLSLLQRARVAEYYSSEPAMNEGI